MLENIKGGGRSAAVAVAPLRVGLVRPRGDPSEPLTPDPLLSAAEPPTAALLELARLAPFGAGRISYAPSRNRQAHAYAVTERRDARSLPLKRVFIRGALRQLSSPAVSFFFSLCSIFRPREKKKKRVQKNHSYIILSFPSLHHKKKNSSSPRPTRATRAPSPPR